jgi:hypothetical protein
MDAPSPTSKASVEIIEIDLRDPYLAALLAWLCPGAGHCYQRRYGKALLFAVCILGIYFFGLALGEGKVVYASWNQVERRWQYPLQMGVGLPSAVAIVQRMRVNRDQEPLWGGLMAPPRSMSELSRWHYELSARFELGTLYTMVAGLLNVLAICDAFAGPMPGHHGGSREGPPRKADQPPGS